MEIFMEKLHNSIPLFILLIAINLAHCDLNLDELKLLNYAIDLNDVPIVQGEEVLGSSLELSTKLGQKYQCSLPDTSLALENEAHANSINLDPSKLDVEGMLKTMESSPCIVLTQSWWTYEFCYKQHISQYHLEEGKEVEAVMKLGYYSSDYEWSPHLDPHKENELKSPQQLNRYHSQYYSNGSVCDLTGEPRKAEVRFSCKEGSGDHIAAVEEPKSCQYIVHIKTNRVCEHSFLKPPAVKKPHLITCQPILLPNQYEKYLQYDRVRKEKEEKKQMKWLKDQEEMDFSDIENKKIKNLDIELDFISVNANDEASKKTLKSFMNNYGAQSKPKGPDESGNSDALESLDYEDDTDIKNSGLFDDLKSEENTKKNNDLKFQEILSLVDKLDKAIDDLSLIEAQIAKDKLAIMSGETIKESILLEDTIEMRNEAGRLEIPRDGQEEDNKYKHLDQPEALHDEQSANVKESWTSLNNKKGDTGIELPLDMGERPIMEKTSDPELQEAVAKLGSLSQLMPYSFLDARYQMILLVKIFDSKHKLSQIILSENFRRGNQHNVVLANLNAIINEIYNSVLKGNPAAGDNKLSEEQENEENRKMEVKHKELEQEILSELEKTGLDTGGKKVQLKIITTRMNDKNALRVFDDDESRALKNMLVSYLSSSYAAEREKKAHEDMEANYHTNWEDLLSNVDEDQKTDNEI